MGERLFRHSVCSLDCPDTCSMFLEIDDHQMIKKVKGDKLHPITQGFLCKKMQYLPERIYHPNRILTPLKRTGEKGSGIFKKISWEQALDDIYEQFMYCIDKYGSESILPYSYAGTMGIINNSSMDRRFFHKLGASKLERTICASAGCTGYSYTMGCNQGVDPEDTHLAELIIIWGTNLISTNIHQWQYFNQARKNGAKIIHIDVHNNLTSKHVDWFIQVRPGTDGALALGMMNVIIQEELFDIDFIDKFTIGFKDLKASVNYYTPEVVSSITGLAKEEIIQLARTYGSSKKSFIRIGNGLQHHYNGGMATRNITCLPALTGAWRYKGCGAIKSNSDYFNINKKQLEMVELDTKGTRTINMNQLGDALTEVNNPSVHALFVYNSNPAIIAPGQNKIIEGMRRQDLFTVVHEIYMTDTAKYADIILPAPTHAEYIDVYRSYWHLYLQLSEPSIPLQGESVQNTELFRKLANRFGFTDTCFQDSDEELIIQAIELMVQDKTGKETYKLLKDKKMLKVISNEKVISQRLDKLSTPSGKIELYSKRMEQDGLLPIPSHKDIREFTIISKESYPYVLVNAPNDLLLNSTFANIESIQEKGRPVLEIHPKDAEDKQLNDGDVVKVFNQRGACLLPIKVTTDVMEGTVVSLGLWWNDLYESNGNLNQLVSQDFSDMGHGAVFFSTFVNVEKV